LNTRLNCDGLSYPTARAHALSGDSATISGYLANGDESDEVMGAFAVAYADQTERDQAAHVDAHRPGRIQAKMDEKM
jgi:hypothetical protein